MVESTCKAAFATEFGIYLDSNLVSNIMNDLWISLAPRTRIQHLTFEFNQTPEDTATLLLLKPVAEANLDEFKQLPSDEKEDLLQITHKLASGERLSEIQEIQPKLKPFHRLREFGKSLKDWVIHDTDQNGAAAIAIDEKVVAKAFDLQKHANYTHHYVSRLKTYKPSIMVEVAALVRSGYLAEVIGHFFPFPQKQYNSRGKRKPLRKHEYLLDFLDTLHQKFGHLTLLADANYATQKLISLLQSKNWNFVMRLNSSHSKLLGEFQTRFAENPDLDFQDKWLEAEKYGGRIRILAYRRVWFVKGTRKEKKYFTITTLDWTPKEIYELYRLRWTLENTFKALPIQDRTPGMNADLIRGFFALSLQVLASLCYQSRSSSRTLARLLTLEFEVKEKRVVWQNISTNFAKRLLSIFDFRRQELEQITLVI